MILILGVVGSLSGTEVDNEGKDGEDVDLDADHYEHPLKVEVVEGRLPSLLQHPLVLPSKQDVKKRRSSDLVVNNLVAKFYSSCVYLFLLPSPSEAAVVGSQADLKD